MERKVNHNNFTKKARSYWNHHPIQGMIVNLVFAFPIMSLIWLLFYFIPILWNDGIKEAFVDYYEQCIVLTFTTIKKFNQKRRTQ
jgi:hypothetical protein